MLPSRSMEPWVLVSLEKVYEGALVVELARRGISFARQLGVPIHDQGVEVGEHVLDLFVDD